LAAATICFQYPFASATKLAKIAATATTLENKRVKEAFIATSLRAIVGPINPADMFGGTVNLQDAQGVCESEQHGRELADFPYLDFHVTGNF
jgi:hypothetical protein